MGSATLMHFYSKTKQKDHPDLNDTED